MLAYIPTAERSLSGELFPREAPRPTRSAAEVDVWKALRAGLPAGWTAWHSLRLRAGRVWEGEGDFVVAVPGRGVVVLEVKGGRISLEGGFWFQNGKPMDKPPRDQANGFVRELVRAVSRRGARVPAFGVACVFPDCEFSEAPSTGDLEQLVLGRRDLQWLSLALTMLVDRVLPERTSTDDAWVRVLHELWGETWVPHVCLRDRVRDAQARLVALNEAQLAILEVAGESSKALVEGGAGSGKTILARELCVRRAAAGRSARFVCFTDALANAVAESFAATGLPGLEATALRRWALTLTGEAAPATAAEWRQLLRRAANDAARAPRTSLLVIDEAQDFEEEDWSLLAAVAENADVWVFRDSAQGFWPERTGTPPLLGPAAARLHLFKQERNPPDVAHLAALYAGRQPAAAPQSGGSLRVVRADDLWAAVDGEVRRLVLEGARADEIAIISLAGQTRAELLQRETIAGFPLARADASDANDRLVADTFLRFKGLERPFVIVTELERGQGDRYETRMHIAVTRATTSCTVIAAGATLAADERLRPLLDAGLQRRA